MANKRIQDLPAKGATIAANDILEVSEYQSPGVYTSKKILGSELGGVTTFTALTDTPASYTGQTLKFVRVNAGETALEFATVSVSDTNIANTQLTLPTGTRKLIWGGANSTDVLVFRNSTDTANFVEFKGTGEVRYSNAPTTGSLVINGHSSGANYIDIQGYRANGTTKTWDIGLDTNGYPVFSSRESNLFLKSTDLTIELRGSNNRIDFYRAGNLFASFDDGGSYPSFIGKSLAVGIVSPPLSSTLGRLHIKGSGSTNATKTLTVVNSSNTSIFEVKDDISIGLYGATPVVQATTGIATSTLVSNAGTALTDTDTFDGYTLKQVVKALRNLGILA